MNKDYFDSLKNSVQGSEKVEDSPTNTSGKATLTVKVDIDAKIYCDGDFLDLVEANIVKKIPIETGQHLITIESENVEGVSEDREIDIKEAGKNYLLIVKGLFLKIEENTKKQEEKKNAEKQLLEEQKKYEDEKLQKEEQQRRDGEQIIEFDNPYCILSYRTTNGESLEGLDLVFNTPILAHVPDPQDGSWRIVYFGKPIKTIPNNAFAFDICKHGIDAMVLPQGVESIGDRAFCGQSELRYVDMPDVIKEIGREAFKGCSSLAAREIFDDFTLTLPKELETIGVEAFSGCVTLKHILFGDSVMNLNNSCFSGCKKLLNVNLPNSIKEIGIGCFSECTSLREVILGNGIQNIYTMAFGHCINLETVIFRSFQCPKISTNCFYDCGNFIAMFACKVDKDSYRRCKDLEGRKNWGAFN